MCIPYAQMYSSRSTAQQRKDVNKHRHHLVCFFPRPYLIVKSPVKFSPVLVNTCSGSLNLSVGIGAIIWFTYLGFSCIHYDYDSGIASAVHTIQNPTDNFANKWLVPIAWWLFLRCCLIISIATMCPVGMMIGYRTSFDNNLHSEDSTWTQ